MEDKVMSNRQPTIEINDQIIAHDEIVEILDLNQPLSSANDQKTSIRSAVKLVNGAILPLPPQKINSIIEFLYRNEQ